MNILPKKRWHVRTKDNIARVRRDEAEAAEKEKERVQRVKLAEQEARTAYLRTKARSKYGDEYSKSEFGKSESQSKSSKNEFGKSESQSKSSKNELGKSESQSKSSKNVEANIYTLEGNINFFKDLEDGKDNSGINKEHEEEKKAEQEKYEKSIGYLTYLGQDSLESKGEKAWYENTSVAKIQDGEMGEKSEEVGLKSKSKLDPIQDIIKYAGLKPSKKILKTSTSKIEVNQVKETTKENRKDILFNSNEELKATKKHKKTLQKKKHKKKKSKHKHSHRKRKNDCCKSSRRSKERKSSHKKRRRDSSSSIEGTHRSKRRRRDSSSSSEGTHRSKRRRRESTMSDSSASESSGESSHDITEEEDRKAKQKKLEDLRAERLKREAEEKRRAERLLAGQKSEAVEALVSSNPGFQRKYNSQYNPHIAKQNQEAKSLESGVKYWLQG